MRSKALEIRDRSTFIPVLAVELRPDTLASIGYVNEEQRYLLARAGLGMEGAYRVAIVKLATGDGKIDPHAWADARTMRVAHEWIAEHWDELKDGSVVDVRFILGETVEPAISERITEPL